MSETPMTKYKCNLCEVEAIAMALPLGWLGFDVEDPQTDAALARNACAICASSIERATPGSQKGFRVVPW